MPSCIILYLRIYLAKENRRRDKLEAEGKVLDTGVVEEFHEDGTMETEVVDNNQLDLTDRENLAL